MQYSVLPDLNSQERSVLALHIDVSCPEPHDWNPASTLTPTSHLYAYLNSELLNKTWKRALWLFVAHELAR